MTEITTTVPDTQNAGQSARPRARVRTFLSRGVTGLLLGLIAGAGLLVAATVLPGLIGFTPVVVLSGSMEPAFKPGDVVVTRAVNPANVQVGDVITYHSGKTFVTHRVIRVVESPQGRSFEMKGDANPMPDAQLVSESRVVATVVYSIPRMGFVVAYANTLLGQSLLIVVPGVLLALLWYRDMQAKKARRRRQALAQAPGNGP